MAKKFSSPGAENTDWLNKTIIAYYC